MARSKQGGSSSFTGESIHFTGTRIRLNGSGTLQMTLRSLDDVDVYSMPDTTMAATSATQPFTLANFISQRACLQGEVTEINEWFVISKISIFIRPVATGLPQ